VLGAQAQAAALHQASGGRLARAGHALLHLQRQSGNRYVQQVIHHARQAADPEAALVIQPVVQPVVQAKLVLGPANDRYEQQADRVAAWAVGHAASYDPDPAAPRPVDEDTHARLQRQSDIQPDIQPGIQQLRGGAGGAVAAPVAQALQRARGGGQPLPATLRGSMEQALGADLGGVRVHTGARSDQLNRSLQAAAFTSGQDIFFRRGAYPPVSPRGTALLAHELTHVVQQRNRPNTIVQRYFDPPANPYQQVPKPVNPLALTRQDPHLSKGKGWAISKDVEQAQELRVGRPARAGHIVKRFTALLTPGHAKLLKGAPTQPQGPDPLGWDWIKLNEVRTTSGKLRYWVRFHLLNADLGGKGTKERHLVPTTKKANARWDQGIERPMKAALEGTAATPVYYDVQLTYWDQGDAPATYQDAATNTNYSPNITLFPRSIEGSWQQYVKGQGRWAAPRSLTVTVDKPRGISGGQVELTQQSPNSLKQLASLHYIDQKILEELQRRARKVSFTTYRDVRQILESWAMDGATSKKISDRYEAIYASDGYLRDALAGAQSFKLTINHQPVPDDATPEAKMFGPPGRVRDYLDLAIYNKVEGPIVTAYMMAQGDPRSGAVEDFPSFEEFLWRLMTKGPLYGVKLADVQQLWDKFKAANEVLPPLRDTHLVPDQDEILVVLQRRTQPLVVQSVRDTFTEQVRLTGPTGATGVVDELAQAVEANYGHLLRAYFPTLTVEHADTAATKLAPKLARTLLEADPVRPLAAELNDRLAAALAMRHLGIVGTLPSDPFSTTLTAPLAAGMQQLVAAEQQRIATTPPSVVAQQPTQPPPTGRFPPYGRPPTRSKTREQINPGLRNRVRNDRRYPADQAGQRKIWDRVEKVEQYWGGQRIPHRAFRDELESIFRDY